MENWELIGKKLNGELSPDEALRFDVWLKSDLSHEAMWNDAQRIWNTTGTLDLSFEPDIEKALSKVKSSPVTRNPGVLRNFFTPLKIAASVVLIVASAFLISQLAREKDPDLIAVHEPALPDPALVQMKIITMSTADSAVSFYLPDSSHIYLNKNSSLSYPENFTGGTREVKLTGEAFFNVTPGTKHPFVILAGNTETRVIGTSFNIKEDKITKKVEVSVVTGKVRFKANKNADHLSEVTLLPNDRATYSESSATMVKRKVKGTEDYWWKKNLDGIRKLLKNAKKGFAKPYRKK
ncbi:MAG: FecR domain-containing protein [Bacteroidota bacterium]|nr:FecR domain-containing protein [Bacteroidota bacterium]